MRLKIHNINKVQEADVKLDGLTVIAGANSSGKVPWANSCSPW